MRIPGHPTLFGKTREVAWSVLRWVGRTPLVPAFMLSFLGHALLLGSIHTQRTGESPRTTMVITLVRAAVSDARSPAQAEPPAQSAPMLAKPLAAPVQADSAAAALEASPVPEAAAAAAREQPSLSGEANREMVFYPAEELGELPIPLATLDISNELGRQLAGRRLLVELRIDPFGAVRQSAVLTGEVNQEAVAQINRALANARFVAGRRQGEAVGALLRMRVCFDPAGGLDTTSDECWDPASPRRP